MSFIAWFYLSCVSWLSSERFRWDLSAAAFFLSLRLIAAFVISDGRWPPTRAPISYFCEPLLASWLSTVEAVTALFGY